MRLSSLKDLYFDELADLYDAETQIVRTLPRLVDAARAPELRESLKKHCDESRLHLERLELIFTHWGERRRSSPCAGLAGIVQEADERLNEAATEDVRDAAIIGAAQRIEHYEIAAYGCARTYARRLNRLDEARLLQETLDEEGRVDRRLTELAEAHINDDARLEADFRTSTPPRRLRYVPMDVVAKGRGSQTPLAVRNDAGDALGDLDGLLADGDLGAVRYAVVDAGGLLSHRRYLLPIRMLRYDERSAALHVSIDKDVAERYPAFDADEFEKLNDEDRVGYESRLLRGSPCRRGARSGCPTKRARSSTSSRRCRRSPPSRSANAWSRATTTRPRRVARRPPPRTTTNRGRKTRHVISWTAATSAAARRPLSTAPFI